MTYSRGSGTVIVRCLEYEPDARLRFSAVIAKLAELSKTLDGVDFEDSDFEDSDFEDSDI